MASEHTLYIAVENCATLVAGERGDRRSRGSADAGKRRERRRIAGKPAGVITNHRLRGRVQMMGATVVAQSAPLLEHAVERRRGETFDRRKLIDEALEVRQHR